MSRSFVSRKSSKPYNTYYYNVAGLRICDVFCVSNYLSDIVL